jgi:hypothetical protein
MPLPEQESSSLLEAALRYAEQGWTVIPLHSPNGNACDCFKGPSCEAPAKHPRTQHGLKDASQDELQIRRWWKTWPQANIGLPIRPGFVAVDIDGKEGLEALREAGYQLAPTAVQNTGRGYHYVYRTQMDMRPAASVLPKVDLRGPGSYIVAAPSRHASGSRYGWQIGLEEIAAAPGWLSQLSRRSPAPTEQDASSPVDMAAVLAGVSEGRRDVELFRAACKLRAADIPIDFALRLVREAAERCSPPFDPDVAERKVNDAYRRYPANAQQRDLPSDATLLGDDSVMVEFEAARFVFHDLEKTGRELQSEMEIQSLLPASPEEPYVQRLNLLSMSAREACRRELEHVFGKAHGWGALLAKAAYKAQDAYLKVDRSVRFSQIESPPALRFIVPEFLPEDGTTILFGAGSSGKTYLLYRLLLGISIGRDFLGRPSERRRCMLVDYETGRGTAGYRMRRVAEGLGLGPEAASDVLFWPARGIPFADQIDAIKRCCDTNEIGVVGLDHLAVACGGDASEQEVAARYYRAAEKLGRTVVALAHITGDAVGKPEQVRRPFGSVFWENGARRTIFVYRHQEQESSVADLGLFFKKVNDGSTPRDIGAVLAFDDPSGPVTIEPSSVRGTPELAIARSSVQRAFDALTRAMTYKELSEACGLTERTLKDILPQHSRLFTKVRDGGPGGAGNATVWARAMRPEDSLPYVDF